MIENLGILRVKALSKGSFILAIVFMLSALTAAYFIKASGDYFMASYSQEKCYMA